MYTGRNEGCHLYRENEGRDLYREKITTQSRPLSRTLSLTTFCQGTHLYRKKGLVEGPHVYREKPERLQLSKSETLSTTGFIEGSYVYREKAPSTWLDEGSHVYRGKLPSTPTHQPKKPVHNKEVEWCGTNTGRPLSLMWDVYRGRQSIPNT